MMTKKKEMTELHYPQLQTCHCSNTQMQRLMYVQKLSNGSWITKISIVGNPPSVLNMLAVRPWANSLCFSCSCSVHSFVNETPSIISMLTYASINNCDSIFFILTWLLFSYAQKQRFSLNHWWIGKINIYENDKNFLNWPTVS